MKMFEFKGTYKEHTSWKNFTRTLEAENEKRAKELLQSYFGSEHHVAKRHLKIESVKPVTQ